MRQIDILITQSRRDTDNVEFTDTTGLSDDDFLSYVNAAQERLQALILNQSSDVFATTGTINLVSGQEAYSLPEDCFLSNRVMLVELSQSGSGIDYLTLRQGRIQERLNGSRGLPSFYIRLNGQLLLQPIPDSTSGNIRVTYQVKLPKLDTRRGTILTATTSGSSITTLTLDPTSLIDKTPILEEGYVTVVDKHGAVKMRALTIDDVDEATGIVTVTPGFTFTTGETITAGDYLVKGKYSTTHSLLPDNCERYLIAYMNWRAYKRDSSLDTSEMTLELTNLENDLLMSFAEPDSDIDFVPIVDTQFLDLDLD